MWKWWKWQNFRFPGNWMYDVFGESPTLLNMFLLTFLRRAAQKRLLRLTRVTRHRLQIKSGQIFDLQWKSWKIGSSRDKHRCCSAPFLRFALCRVVGFLFLFAFLFYFGVQTLVLVYLFYVLAILHFLIFTSVLVDLVLPLHAGNFGFAV